MKKILPILLALLAALAVQTPAFADGETMESEPMAVAGESEGNTPALDDRYTDSQGIIYTLDEDNKTAAVSGCTKDAISIEIPLQVGVNGNNYLVTSIGDFSFQNCTDLKSVIIPNSVSSIGESAFRGCGLETIEIPNGVTSIGSRAFAFSSLKTIKLPDSITSIGEFAFHSSTLESIEIPSGVTSIEKSTFSLCSDLTNLTVLGDLSNIDSTAFAQCTRLINVDFKGEVSNVGMRAFYLCSDMTSITFAGTNPPIFDLSEYSTFDGCSSLETIYLSEDLTPEQRAVWETALQSVMPTGCKIVYTDLTPDPEPTTPPADTSTAIGTASAHTVQQLEAAERPDPMDVEANKQYDFWIDVKADLRAATDGKTLRIHVPASYTNMPASVMEQIRLLDKDITVDLRWNGERLLITPATAQRKTVLKAYWTFAQLCKLYAQ